MEDTDVDKEHSGNGTAFERIPICVINDKFFHNLFVIFVFPLSSTSAFSDTLFDEKSFLTYLKVFIFYLKPKSICEEILSICLIFINFIFRRFKRDSEKK